MRRRKAMSRHHSKRSFSHKSGVHPKNNVRPQILRGGYRL